MRKVIAIIVISMFLLTSITVTAASRIPILSMKERRLAKMSGLNNFLETTYDFDGETTYVDDDNIAGPWDGTQEYPYQYIQDAINASLDGDTVFVYNGSYYENIVVDKTIRLTGEDKNITSISGNGNVDIIRIDANWTEISGFAIIGDNRDTDGIRVKGKNCTISENIIIATVVGISAWFQGGLSIYKNIIHTNNMGMLLVCCDDNHIIDNIIYNNDGGIWLLGLAFYPFNDYCENNEIALNTISNNQYGISLRWCKESYIYINSIENNGIVGISLDDSNKTIICFNAVEKNGGNPDPLMEEITPGGIYLDNSSGNIIFNNIKDNEEYGVKVVNCSVTAKWNWWGSFLGPSRTDLGLLGDWIIVENGKITVFPWLPFKNPLAGDDEEWKYIY